MRLDAGGLTDAKPARSRGAGVAAALGRGLGSIPVPRRRPATIPAAVLEGTELIHLAGGETLACPGTDRLPIATSALAYGLGSASLALPAAKVLRLRGVRVLPGQRVAISESGSVVAECLTGDMLGSVRLGDSRRRQAVHTQGTAALYRSPWTAQYHTLVDHLPRAALLAQPAVGRLGPIRLLHDGPLSPMEALLLPRILPSRVQLQQVEPDSVLTADSVLVPGYVTRPAAGAIPTWYRRWIDREAASIHDEVHGGEPHRFPRRFFIERHQTRRVRNRGALDALLDEHGLAVLDPSELSAAELVAAFQGATLVVGVTGSGLANTLFCRNARVIELLPGAEMFPHFFYLATSKGLAYDFVAALPDGRRRSAMERLDEDINVDTAALAELLQSA